MEILGGEELRYIEPRSVLSTKLAEVHDDAAKKEEEGDGGGNENREGGRAGKRGVLGGLSTPYMKWIIAPPTEQGEEKEERDKELQLPPGYHYDRPRAERGELKLVLSRTDIPRSEATLAKLGSVGIRYLAPSNNLTPNEGEKGREEIEEKGQLISWAFLGPDGSLTSLHVEKPHRGQGLAKAVAKRLFKALRNEKGRMEMGFRCVDVGREGGGNRNGDGGWAHSDVSIENRESAGVARGLGGREGWVIRWVHVDLGRVRGVVSEEFRGGGGR